MSVRGVCVYGCVFVGIFWCVGGGGGTTTCRRDLSGERPSRVKSGGV